MRRMVPEANQPHNAPANTGAAGVAPGSAVRTARRLRSAYRLVAVACVLLGCALLAANLGMLPGPTAGWPAAAGAVAVTIAGLLLMLSGVRRWAPALPAFAVERDAYNSAALEANTGTADLQVSAYEGPSQLAVGQFPSHRGPRLEAAGGQAWLVLEPRLALPYLPGAWVVALTKVLPWTLDLRSTMGHFDLQLCDVPIRSLKLRSTIGSAELALPAQVPSAIEVRLGLGDLTVRLPDFVPLHLVVEGGRLATVTVDEASLQRLGPGEWATPGLAPGDSRPCCTLHVELGTGDLVVE